MERAGFRSANEQKLTLERRMMEGVEGGGWGRRAGERVQEWRVFRMR